MSHLSAAATTGRARWLVSMIGARFDAEVHNARRLALRGGRGPAAHRHDPGADDGHGRTHDLLRRPHRPACLCFASGAHAPEPPALRLQHSSAAGRRPGDGPGVSEQRLVDPPAVRSLGAPRWPASTAPDLHGGLGDARGTVTGPLQPCAYVSCRLDTACMQLRALTARPRARPQPPSDTADTKPPRSSQLEGLVTSQRLSSPLRRPVKQQHDRQRDHQCQSGRRRAPVHAW